MASLTPAHISNGNLIALLTRSNTFHSLQK